MIRKLSRHGTNLALVLEKPILDLLGIDANTPLSVTTDGTCLIIAPARTSGRRMRFQKAVAQGNRKYGTALRRLST